MAAADGHDARHSPTRTGRRLFDKYPLTPEYALVNNGMDLDEFKRIFWWEYFHRLLGRLIGVAFLVPYLWFLVRRRIAAGIRGALAGIFALGGLQGALGWYMVKTGSSTTRGCRSSG